MILKIIAFLGYLIFWGFIVSVVITYVNSPKKQK